MENFIYSNPTKIIFGKNTVSKIGKEVVKYGQKALLVYGKGSIKKNGVYDIVIESLNKNNISFVEHCGVKPNPVLSHVKEGIDIFKKEKCDIIIAVGGGSVIDESKAISCGVCYDGDVWDFFVDRGEIKKSVPLFVVLTLPATGSESNSGAVITNEKTSQKYSAHSYHLFPKISILDPSTTFSLPSEQTVYGAIDSILHVSEGFFTTSDRDSMITDNYIYAVIRTLMKSTDRIFKNPQDYNARASFMWSATLALNGQQALGYKNIEFVNHVIEHSLSAIYDIPHGLGLSIVFPGFLRFLVSKNDYSRILEFGENIFNIKSDGRKETALKVIDEIEKWFKSLGLKTKLNENSIFESDFDKIINNAMELGELWGWSYSKKDVLSILSFQK